MRIGINGLGRIGRALMRLVWSCPDVEVAAVNDVAPAAALAHLLRHDSVAGLWDVPLASSEGEIRVGDRVLPCWRRDSPEQIPWSEQGVEVVIEATGKFQERAAALGHLGGTVRNVVISSPSRDADFTVVWGVNQQRLDPRRDRILSNASCTTQCAGPLISLLHGAWGIEGCVMTTVHCYTNDQTLMDAPHRDLRRSRAAAMSMIPTSTSAAIALEQVFPDLRGRIACLAVRVPTPFVSAVELVAELSKPATREDAERLVRAAATADLAGIVGICDEPLVSVDFRGDTRSAVVDAALLCAPSPRLLRLFAWYDNESGYTRRLLDLLQRIASTPGSLR